MRYSVFVGTKRATPSLMRDLATALKMFDAAHENYDADTRDRIYAATGWWKGTDGKWRFEIRDVRPKKRGMTLAEGSTYELLKKHGLRHENGIVFDQEGVGRAPLTTFCTHTKLFKAYPELKGITVELVDPDTVDFAGEYSEDNNTITLTFDCVEWYDDEASNVLNSNGIETLTHELQHAVQGIEGFARGGSPETVGAFQYRHLAGEVEARNASRRIGHHYANIGQTDLGTWDKNRDPKLAPWQTEDVDQDMQMLYTKDGKEVAPRGWFESHPEYAGNPLSNSPIARFSVSVRYLGGADEEAPRAAVRAKPSLHSHEDLAVGLIGQRLLAGKETKPEYVSQLLNSLGVKDVNAADAVAKAEALVEKHKASAQGRINAGDPALMTDLATEAMRNRVSERLMSAYATGAADMDPELGRRVLRWAVWRGSCSHRFFARVDVSRGQR